MIPEKINVCGVPHTVLLVDDNFTIDSHFGEIDYIKAEIKINRKMPEPLQMQTLCHEWLHGALVMLGFNAETQNEQFVQALASAMSQTFLCKPLDNEGGTRQFLN